MRMKRRQIILGGCCTWCMLYSVYVVLGVCCTWCMLYSVDAVLGVCCTWCMLYYVYAVLGVNSWSWYGKIERDDLTLFSPMMVELWTRKREMGEEDDNHVEDTSGNEKSGVWLAWMGWEDLGSVLLHTGSGPLPAVFVMVNWLAHAIVLSPSLAWWFPPSPLTSLFLILNSTITYEHEVQSSLCISPCHDQKLKPGTAYTDYSIHWVLHTLRTASFQDRLSPTASLSADPVVLNSLHSDNYEITYESNLSSRHASLPNYHFQFSCLPGLI